MIIVSHIFFASLRLALSSIINIANEEMKDIVRLCLSGTSIEQRLRDINNDETTIEQMDNEYDCIGKLGDEICQVGCRGYRIQNSLTYEYFIQSSHFLMKNKKILRNAFNMP
jgi:hypothetical protein